MRNYYLLFIALLSFFTATSQEDTPPEETVIAFFNAFHQQDTLALRELIHERIKMQSIETLQNGSLKLSTTSFDNFLKSIASIPTSTYFEERILDYEVRSDGMMANVWTPYEFYVDYILSHCGVNNFQLMREGDQWKIFYIVDTRKREDCK